MEVTNPYSGARVGTLWQAARQDAAGILEAAEKGQTALSRMPLYQRADILLAYANLLSDNIENLAALQCAEMGKVIAECREELEEAVSVTKGYAERAKHLYGKTFPAGQPGLESDLLFTRREAIGVVLCIIPFNFPAELFTHKVVPALAMGNATIVKLPDENPLMALELVQLLVQAGMPKEAVGALCCTPEFSSEYILSTSGIRAVSFTGSPGAGSKVVQAAAPRLHKTFLELGGNDPFIVFADAPLSETVEEIIEGRVANCGQNCCASKRFIVHRDIYNALADKLANRLAALVEGDPANENTEIGYITTEKRAKIIEEQVRHTVEQGATLRCGGERRGCFVQPALLTGVAPSMDIATHLEIFGPVLPLIPFGTPAEAIEIANSTPYGLQAGIMGGNLRQCVEVAGQLQCGAVVLNGSGNYRHGEMPFGGHKKTGNSREGISTTLEEMSEEKTFILKDAFPQA